MLFQPDLLCVLSTQTKSLDEFIIKRLHFMLKKVSVCVKNAIIIHKQYIYTLIKFTK